MKAIIRILAVSVAAAGIITAAGCSKSKSSAKTATYANWNARTAVSAEGNFTERWLGNTEVAEYTISYTDGNNGTYAQSVDESSSYKTEFGMVNFDWSKIANLPEGYAPADDTEKVELAYFYKTTLDISGKYYKGTGENRESRDFADSVETVCYFKLAGANLQPIYSEQKIKSTSLANGLASVSLQYALVEMDCDYITYYSANGKKATMTETDNLKSEKNVTTKEVWLTSKAGYSVFDNSQLRAAVRAFNIAGSATYTFDVVVPQNMGKQSVKASSSSPAELKKASDEELQPKKDENGGIIESSSEKKARLLKEQTNQIIAALDTCGENHPDYIFFDKGEGENEKNYRYNAVTMAINTDSNMVGSSATLWYSTVENSEINSTKCVLLRMSTPLSFGMGTLNYSLKSLSLQANS